MSITEFSRAVVNWNVIFFDLLSFLMKILKSRKNEPLKRSKQYNEKMNILPCLLKVEQTLLYTLVYKTFLYNPTSLKLT